MLAWLLRPSNLLIMALVVLLATTWAGYHVKKTQLAEAKAALSVCQRDVSGYQAEMASANRVIEALKANLESVKRQLGEWKQVAAESEAFAQRLLKAAEAKATCEEYNAENARLVDEFVRSFNNSVRRKISYPGASGDRATEAVVPKAGAPEAR